MTPLWQGASGGPRAVRGSPLSGGAPPKSPPDGRDEEEGALFYADPWGPSGDTAEAADAHNVDTFGLDAPVGDDWQPDEASYVQFEMMKKGLPPPGRGPPKGLELPAFFTTDEKGDALEVVLESLEPESPPSSSSSSSSSRRTFGADLRHAGPPAASAPSQQPLQPLQEQQLQQQQLQQQQLQQQQIQQQLQQQQMQQQQMQQQQKLPAASQGFCNSAATQHLTSLLLGSASLSGSVSSPSDSWSPAGPPPGFELKDRRLQQQQQPQRQGTAAASAGPLDKRPAAPFLLPLEKQLLPGAAALQRGDLLQPVSSIPAAAFPSFPQQQQQQQQPLASPAVCQRGWGDPQDLWAPPLLTEQQRQQQQQRQLQQQQQQQQLLPQQQMQQQRQQQLQQHQEQQGQKQLRQQDSHGEVFEELGGVLQQQQEQQQQQQQQRSLYTSDKRQLGSSRGLTWGRQEQQRVRGPSGGAPEGMAAERPSGSERGSSRDAAAAGRMPQQAAAAAWEQQQQQQQGRNQQQQQQRRSQQQQQQARRQQEQQQKGRHVGPKQQQQQQQEGFSRKTEIRGPRLSSACQLSAAGRGDGGGPPPIFPMTRGLIDLIIKQKLPDASRWFKPPPEEEGLSDPAASSSSSNNSSNNSSSSNAGFMNAQDLDLILRVQLAQMARRPELQKYTGRWNFRGLKGPSGAPSGDLSPAELETRLRELAGGGLLAAGVGIGIGIASARGGDLAHNKALERLRVDCSQEGVLVSSSSMHQKLLGSLDPREAEGLISLEERGGGDSSLAAEETDPKNSSSSNNNSSSAHMKFGKVAYSSIRHPRNMIHLEDASSLAAAAEDGSNSSSSSSKGLAAEGRAASGGGDPRTKDRSQEIDLIRKLSLGWPGLSRLESSLMLKAAVEDCQDLRISAASLQAELQECPASHVGARGLLQQQLQQVLLQAFELLTLRHGCISQGFPLPFLLDFASPAVCPVPADYCCRLKHNFYSKQQQQHQQHQQQGGGGFLERLPADLQLLAADGRRSTRWMLTSVCSSSKGLRLLLGLLPMLSDACSSALLQGLLSCSELLLKACCQADAVVLAAAARLPAAAAAAAAGDNLSSSLFEETLRCRGTAALAVPAQQEDSLLHALLHAPPAGELAALWGFISLGFLKVLKAAGPSRSAVLAACIDFFCWGTDHAAATAIAGTASGTCLFGLLTLHLPHADSAASAWEAEAARRFLYVETDVLVSLMRAHVGQPSERQQLQRLRPFVHALLQQARLCPAWAATITTRVTTLLGEDVARALLASLVRADPSP